MFSVSTIWPWFPGTQETNRTIWRSNGVNPFTVLHFRESKWTTVSLSSISVSYVWFQRLADRRAWPHRRWGGPGGAAARAVHDRPGLHRGRHLEPDPPLSPHRPEAGAEDTSGGLQNAIAHHLRHRQDTPPLSRNTKFNSNSVQKVWETSGSCNVQTVENLLFWEIAKLKDLRHSKKPDILGFFE